MILLSTCSVGSGPETKNPEGQGLFGVLFDA
jgi:hypothetical protein